MADEKFDLIFRGELVPGADLAQVKQNLSRLFKMDLARVELLFSGKPVVLKRGMDLDAAGKYRVAIKKAGARIDTVASRTAAKEEGVAATSKSQNVPVQPATSPHAATPQAPRPVPGESEGGLTLAPAGGDLLTPEEKPEQAAVAVDISGLSLRPAEGSLLDEGEREEPVPLPLDLAGLDMAPVGADVLRPDERKPLVEVSVDLSAMSLAPPGERLESPKAVPPPAPDTSSLSLLDND